MDKMLAACKTPKGTRILAESPTITLPGNPRDSAGVILLNQLINTQLSNLPAATRQEFHTLHNNYTAASGLRCGGGPI